MSKPPTPLELDISPRLHPHHNVPVLPEHMRRGASLRSLDVATNKKDHYEGASASNSFY